MPGLVRTSRRSSLPVAAALIAAGAALVAIIEVALMRAPPAAPWVALLFPAAACVYVAVGLASWLRRPGSMLGPLLVFGGGVIFAAGLLNVGSEWLAVLASIVATVPLAVIIHLLLAFPSGRLRERAERRVVAAGYAVSLVLQVPLYVFAPAGKLSAADEPGLAQAGLQVQRAVGACVVLAACWLLVQRIRAADPQRRRVLVALDVFAVLALLSIPVSGAMSGLWGGPTLTQAAVQLTLLGLVPLAFAAAASRGAFARTADLAELAAWLGADEARRPTPRDALAGALGDPTLELLFALPGGEGLIDQHGAPAFSPASHSGSRGVVDVDLARARVGAIVYDPRVLDRPDEVREAGRVLALAIDRERLVATLRASRARIAAAGDEERRRIARDLHDGLQSRLVFLKIQAGMGASGAELSAGIEGAIDDLRELVDGVMPEPLAARGLPAAVIDLVDRLPAPVTVRVEGLEERLPSAVESAAYFVVSEALVNAVKHAGADGLAVALERAEGELRIAIEDKGDGAVRAGGDGMRGMHDRVGAVGGVLTVEPRPGTGTSVRATIPVATAATPDGERAGEVP